MSQEVRGQRDVVRQRRPIEWASERSIVVVVQYEAGGDDSFVDVEAAELETTHPYSITVDVCTSIDAEFEVFGVVRLDAIPASFSGLTSAS